MTEGELPVAISAAAHSHLQNTVTVQSSVNTAAKTGQYWHSLTPAPAEKKKKRIHFPTSEGI